MGRELQGIGKLIYGLKQSSQGRTGCPYMLRPHVVLQLLSLPRTLGVLVTFIPSCRKDHISTRILQTMVLRIPSSWALEPECRSFCSCGHPWGQGSQMQPWSVQLVAAESRRHFRVSKSLRGPGGQGGTQSSRKSRYCFGKIFVESSGAQPAPKIHTAGASMISHILVPSSYLKYTRTTMVTEADTSSFSGFSFHAFAGNPNVDNHELKTRGSEDTKQKCTFPCIGHG